MNRKDFLTKACSAGFCSCTVAAMFSSTLNAESAEASKAEKNAEPPKEDWRIGFAQERYAVLLKALEQEGGAPALEKALHQVGGYCASKSEMLKANEGKPLEYMEAMRRSWNAKVDYDEKQGLVRISFATEGTCPCPLVKTGLTPSSVCQCSVGMQQRAMSTVFKRPVKVELKESLLRGSNKCSFEVRLV